MRSVLSSSEAAEILGCGSDNIRRLAREGQLRPVIVSRIDRLFDRRDVEKLAAARREPRSSAQVAE